MSSVAKNVWLAVPHNKIAQKFQSRAILLVKETRAMVPTFSTRHLIHFIDKPIENDTSKINFTVHPKLCNKTFVIDFLNTHRYTGSLYATLNDGRIKTLHCHWKNG